MEICVDGEILHEQAEEPVDREQGRVHAMRFWEKKTFLGSQKFLKSSYQSE